MEFKIQQLDEIKSTEINYLNATNQTLINIYKCILVIIVLMVVICPFVTVDVTTRAPLTIQSSISNEDIFFARSGVVNNIYFKENDDVKKNQLLLSIDDSFTKKQINLSADRQKNLTNALHDITELRRNPLEKAPDLLTSQYRSEFANMLEEQLNAKNKLEKSVSNYERFNKLYVAKVITQGEWEDHMLDYKQATSAFNSLKKKFDVQLLSEAEQLKSQLYNDQQAAIENKEIKQKSNVFAHVDGTIYLSSAIKNGSSVVAGQKFAEIIPSNNLIAVAYVTPKDIGLIRIHQIVKIQITAFNYTEWGTLSGNVIDINKDAIESRDKAPVFKVKVRLERTYLILKNGYKGKITKDMVGSASFLLVKRTLWQLLYDNINNWINPSSN